MSIPHFDAVSRAYHAKYPFIEGRSYVFFGEIPSMPGPCVVADHKTGQILSGYRTDDFVEIPDDET